MNILKKILSVASRSLWNSAELASALIFGVGSALLLAKILGRQEYGAFVLVTVFASLSLLANLGIGITLTRLIAAFPPEGRNAKLTRYLSAGYALVATSCLVVAVLCYVFSEKLIAMTYVGGGSVTHGSYLPVFIACLISLQAIDSVGQGALRGLEKFRRNGAIDLTNQFLSLTFCCISATLFQSGILVAAALISVATLSASLRLIALFAKQEFTVSIRSIRKADAIELIGYGKWITLQSSTSLAFGTMDRLLIGGALGPSVLATYNICIQVGQLVQQIPAALYSFLLPTLSRRSTTEGGITSLFGTAFWWVVFTPVFLALILSGALYAMLPALSGVFSVASGLTNTRQVFFIVLAAYSVLAISIFPYYVLMALGKARTVSLNNLVSAVVSIALAPYLVSNYGIFGAALSRLAYPIGGAVLLAATVRELKSKQ